MNGHGDRLRLSAKSHAAIHSHNGNALTPRTGTHDVEENRRHLADSRASHQDRPDAADARHLPRRLSNPGADPRSGQSACYQQPKRRRGRHARSGRHAQRQPPERCHDLRPGHHALHLGLDYLPAPGQRLSTARTAAERGRSRPEENQRIHPLRHLLLMHDSKLVLHRLVCRVAGSRRRRVSEQRRRPDLVLENHHRADHDRRHDLSHVARRADRRIRHRQRHQPVDHGRHPGPHAVRRLPVVAAGLARAQRRRHETRHRRPDRAGSHVRRRRHWRGVHHARAAADPHAERQARPRPPRLRRHQATTCRSRSIRPASCRSSSPAAC